MFFELFDKSPFNTLFFWLNTAQIITGLTSVLTVLISLIVLKNTIKQNEKDINFGNRPIILLNVDGYFKEFTFEPRQTFDIWSMVGASITNRDLEFQDESFGQVRNYGRGPAINIQVAWIIEEIRYKSTNEKADSNLIQKNHIQVYP